MNIGTRIELPVHAESATAEQPGPGRDNVWKHISAGLAALCAVSGDQRETVLDLVEAQLARLEAGFPPPET